MTLLCHLIQSPLFYSSNLYHFTLPSYSEPTFLHFKSISLYFAILFRVTFLLLKSISLYFAILFRAHFFTLEIYITLLCHFIQSHFFTLKIYITLLCHLIQSPLFYSSNLYDFTLPSYSEPTFLLFKSISLYFAILFGAHFFTLKIYITLFCHFIQNPLFYSSNLYDFTLPSYSEPTFLLLKSI